MKKWNVLNEFKVQSSKFKVDELISILLKNRGINTKKEIEEFLQPKLEEVTIENVGIDKKQLQIALKRIQSAIKKKEQIVVFGDYDVDGICGTAILWETIRNLSANVMPYIPHRVDEGYGLSMKGISNVKSQISNAKLIITVDNGIVAHEAVKFAQEQGIDVIITDHHTRGETDPEAVAIVHTTKLCGTGVGWMLSLYLLMELTSSAKTISELLTQIQQDERNDHLALVALATIADVVPLVGPNRTVTKFGLEKLRKTKRTGLLALFREAGIVQYTIDVYQVGHIICPRLNAMGRLEYAMESLRLLCTTSFDRATMLADKLGATNKERQGLTQETILHAKGICTEEYVKTRKLLFIAHESYQQGVIGLVAGRLVEEYYRPAIVLSIGEQYSKASARSIAGFNIIEFIRSASDHLVNAGGHPMAAGFTVETSKLTILQEFFETKAQELLNDDSLTRILRIDCELPLSAVTYNMYASIQSLAPFGMANPEPTFMAQDVRIENMKIVGKDGRHLKITCTQPGCAVFDAIAFGMAERKSELSTGKKINIAYTIAEDTWNGNRKLQLKIKDIQTA